MKITISLLSQLIFSVSLCAETLTISTFNIKWYGLGGDKSGSSKKELRDPHLKKFIQENLSDSDIIAFQEIVDIERLEKNVIAKSWKCHSYDHKRKKHQHVVLCLSPKFQFVKQSDDDNFAVESVAIGSQGLRPALLGVLQDKKGKNLMHIGAVHLKARADSSKRRIKQMKVLAKRLGSLRPKLPVLVLGDFNTHSAIDTGQKRDDHRLFSQIFQKHLPNLKQVPIDKNTFKTPWNKKILDRIWMTTGLKSIAPVEVWKACLPGSEKNKLFGNTKYYNRNVSDHCPVTIKIKLPEN